MTGQKEQMKFSDAITRRYARNVPFLAQQRTRFESIDWSRLSDITRLNETSIGNAAFVAHWNPEDVFWQEVYKALLSAVFGQTGNSPG